MNIQLLKDVSDYIELFYEEFSEEEVRIEDFIVECCQSGPVHISGSRPVHISESRIPDVEIETKTFAQTLFGYIDDRGMTDGQAANRSGVDRRVMSKIRTNPNYTPTKKTIFSLAVGIRLTEEETEELLMKAGYAFTNTSKFDLIVRYFIENSNYDIWELNEVLNYYGEEPVCC
ncbi:MAG: hypothetical protein MJ161_05305 [Clostridia bacterium]|nr:hypothetical protein [Clostridia bacterium]